MRCLSVFTRTLLNYLHFTFSVGLWTRWHTPHSYTLWDFSFRFGSHGILPAVSRKQIWAGDKISHDFTRPDGTWRGTAVCRNCCLYNNFSEIKTARQGAEEFNTFRHRRSKNYGFGVLQWEKLICENVSFCLNTYNTKYHNNHNLSSSISQDMTAEIMFSKTNISAMVQDYGSSQHHLGCEVINFDLTHLSGKAKSWLCLLQQAAPSLTLTWECSILSWAQSPVQHLWLTLQCCCCSLHHCSYSICFQCVLTNPTNMSSVCLLLLSVRVFVFLMGSFFPTAAYCLLKRDLLGSPL